MDASAWLLIIAVIAVVAAPFVTLSAVSTWRSRRKPGKTSATTSKEKEDEDRSSGYW